MRTWGTGEGVKMDKFEDVVCDQPLMYDEREGLKLKKMINAVAL